MPTVSSYTPTGDPYIDGLLDGVKWAVTSLTFSFPTSASYYGSGYGWGEPSNNFEAFTTTQQAAVRTILQMYSSVTNLTFTEVTETSTQHGDLRYAESDAPSTAWAYYPTTAAEGGDAWFNNSKNWYDNPVKGNYAWLTMLHETGHAVGLKHPHEAWGAFGAMPADKDSLEYSVMSYHSYVGSTASGYTNGTYSYPQTLMMYDIAALQTLYGANYNTSSGDTVYSWSATTGEMFVNGVGEGAPGGNKIFMTLWDGGGHDTYDFSNYTTNLTVNLSPGAWTTVSTTQLAALGSGHYAAGNIANALLYNNNPASLIEDAIGGSGHDTIIGNIADNALKGGTGNDNLDGVSGTNTAVYSGNSANYSWVLNADGTWTVTDLGSGYFEGIDILANIQYLRFSDTVLSLDSIADPPAIQPPTIASFSDDSGVVGDRVTNDNTLTLSGTAAANSTVKIYDGATLLGSTEAEGSGAWTYTTAVLNNGLHSFTATATDVDGNTSAASTALVVTIDTTPPVAPIISSFSPDTGTVGDGITNENTLTLNGTAEANSTVKVYAGATLLGSTIANGSGAWSYTTAALPDGTHSLTATAIDAAGNTSAASAFLSVTVDTTVIVTSIEGVTITGTRSSDLIDATHTPARQPYVTDGNDTIYGMAGSDVIYGNGGDDYINGGAGNDKLYGGAGNDTLIGGAGVDLLFGGEGDDTFVVSGTNDTSDKFDGGPGADTILVTGTKSLTLAGFNALTSSIEIWQGNGLAVLGTSAANVFDFSALQSMTGVSYVDAGSGNDTIIGSQFDDVLRGNKGNDVLVGGQGNDTLSGGAGNDTFVFGWDSGNDTITDLTAGAGIADVIKFEEGIFADFASVLAAATQVGTTVVISYGEDNTLTLLNMTVAKLNADDFVLASNGNVGNVGLYADLFDDQAPAPLGYSDHWRPHHHWHHTDFLLT